MAVHLDMDVVGDELRLQLIDNLKQDLFSINFFSKTQSQG